MLVNYKPLFFTLLHAARCLELLEDASLRLARPSPLFRHATVQSTDTTLPFDTNAYLV